MKRMNKAELEALRGSELFDQQYYLAQYPDVKMLGMDPLEHYLWVGKKMGRKPCATASKKVAVGSIGGNIKSSSTLAERRRSTSCYPSLAPAVIIPVYNAPNEVDRCLASVLTHTPRETQIIVIDDASTDPQIEELLRRYSTTSNLFVFRNPTNLGYTRTVNRGLSFAGARDVVLLNSDTRVTPNWLQRLRSCAYSDNRIATVTPLSNNAGAFSAPIAGQENELPDSPGLDACSRLIAHCSESIFPVVPTGNGFCLYIKRACLDEVGGFDSSTFPRGYGEENDFCMRAGKAGWKHVIDDRSFVYHVRSASFGSQKQALIAEGRKRLDERHPTYSREIGVFSKGSEVIRARENVGKALELARAGVIKSPKVLFVVSTQTGGTPQTNLDLMRALLGRYEPLLLRCDTKNIELSTLNDGNIEVIDRYKLSNNITAFPHVSEEYDNIILSILQKYNIELLHIRHIAWHSLNLTKICKQFGIPIVFSFHDFYTICPTIKLLDENLSYCGGRCTKSVGTCKHELWPDEGFSALKHGEIYNWQSNMSVMLSSCDAFVTTSHLAKLQIEQVYPEIIDKPFAVIPHGRDLEMQSLGRTEVSGRIRILIPGNINEAKGSAIISKIASLDTAGEFEFHILGNARHSLRASDRVILHGAYRRDEFAERVAAIKPDFGAIFSVWPETYCHTLTEMWAAGLPVAAIDLGAVGERIRNHGGGWPISSTSPEQIHETLRKIKTDEGELRQKRNEVELWQSGYGLQANTQWMSDGYDAIYTEQLLRRSTQVVTSTSAEVRPVAPEIAVVPAFWGKNGAVAGTGWVRMILPYQRFAERVGAQIKIQPPSVLPKPGSAKIAVLQRDATLLDLRQLTEWHDRWREGGGKLVYDVDDDLSNVHALEGRVKTNPSSIVEKSKWLAQTADRITVSTDPLAEIYRQLNPDVVVVPNYLDSSLWRLEKSSEVSRRVSGAAIRIGYIGTPTHDDDLLIVQSAMESIQYQFGKSVTFEVMGGFNDSTKAFGASIPLPKDNEYPEFVRWALSKANWDIGIIPLRDSSFNKSKSNLKFLEFAALDLAIVCSDVGAYRDVARHGKNCLLVDESTDAWVRAISSLIRNAALRGQLSKAARAHVSEWHTIQQNGARYDAIFEQLL